MIEEDKDWRKVANFRPIMVSSGQKKGKGEGEKEEKSEEGEVRGEKKNLEIKSRYRRNKQAEIQTDRGG